MPKIGFLFPGQGAQTIGMGKKLYESLPAAKQLFDDAAAVLGYPLADVCFNGPAEKLNSTAVCQPAIYVCSLAALESLRAQQPDVVTTCAGAAGLSLGEYTALTFAGVLDFREGLQLVQKRGAAMQSAADATPSGMVSIVGTDVRKVEDLCRQASAHGPIKVANMLTPKTTVVSGSKAACDAIEPLAKAAGVLSVRLAVAGAFHTDLMKPADQTLAGALQGITLRQGRVPVWSNVDAKPHTNGEEVRDLLVRQVLQPVLWEGCVRAMIADGFDKFYEIGPGRVLTNLFKQMQISATCQNIPV